MHGVRRGLSRVLEGIVLSLMTLLALLVVVAVGFRKAGLALVWYDELASILLAWLTFYGAALAALHRRHIGFDQLVERSSGRSRIVLTAVGKSVTVAFFLVVAWTGVHVSWALSGTYLVGLPWLPVSVTQSVVPIGAALFIVAELLRLPEDLRGVASAVTDRTARGSIGDLGGRQ